MTSTMLAHAHDYADQGLEVFPLRPDKTPYTTHGHNEASSDPFTVERWWKQWPDALIGCRIPRDMIVLDIDIRHGGGDTWAALEAEAGAIPTGRVHWSGRGDGGRHLWFRRPDGPLSMRAMHAWAKEHGTGHAITATKWSCGIDLLHHGHRYTILPPSIHADSGNPYIWGDSALSAPPGELHPYVVALLHREPEVVAPPPEHPRGTSSADSPMDWYRTSHTWRSLLGAHGWTVVSGDGDHDGSRWRHPLATASYSATIKHGCLFVYSPNTPFDETADGEPRGYTLGRAYAVLEHDGDLTRASRSILDMRDGPRAQRQSDDFAWIEPPAATTVVVDGEEPADDDGAPAHTLELVDWSTFWDRDLNAATWVVEPLIAEGRGHALFAPGGTGKSLLGLCIAAAVATGRPILNKPQGPPRHVLYLDYEMTDLDLQERLESMGYGPDDDLAHLHYALLPSLPPLDTREGAVALVAAAVAVGAEFVVIDTFGRAVAGDENEADTVRNFYRMTGMALKARGIASLRIDHAGKDLEKGQRGTSAKNDDVDVVWQLRKADGGFVAVAKKRRMGWIPETVDIAMSEDDDGVLTFTCEPTIWPTGTMQTADWTKALGIDPTTPVRKVMAILRAETDRPALAQTKTNVVTAALRYRRQRETILVSDWLVDLGKHAGKRQVIPSPDVFRETEPTSPISLGGNARETPGNTVHGVGGSPRIPIRDTGSHAPEPEPARPSLKDLDW